MQGDSKQVLITLGDPAGIGPEIVVKAFRDAPQVLSGCAVLGGSDVLQRAGDLLGFDVKNIPFIMLQKEELFPHISYGQMNQKAGEISAFWVKNAAQRLLSGQAAAMVTAPIHKESWGLAGVPFPGHTELLQHEAAAFAGVGVQEMPVRMMLANQELRTVLVSIHVSLREAIERVTEANVLETIRITHEALLPILKRAPRIAVAGLNPHAGEGGLFGLEEKLAISPAVLAGAAMKIEVTGPYAPDTVFMQARGFERFDVVIAMTHDHGLIPVKYLGVEHGVNVTLGLHNGAKNGTKSAGKPLIRTSPDHGTAFDIAGKGVADARSMIEAVRQAKLLAGLQ